MNIRMILAPVLSCVFAAGSVGCGVLNAIRPTEAAASDGATKGGAGAAAEETDGEWDYGEWSSKFGTIKFAKAGEHKFTGTYDGGTLDCSGRLSDLACTWSDNTGSGKARFHWEENGNATGTFGNGESDTDQGPWDLRWGAGGTVVSGGSSGSGSSSSSKDIVLSNDCSQSVEVCIVGSNGGSHSTQRYSAHSNSHVNIDVGGKVTSRSGSSCGNTIAEITASTDKVSICK